MTTTSERLEEAERHLADARSSVFAAMRVVGEVAPGQTTDLKGLFHATDDAMNRLVKARAKLEEVGL